MACSGFCLSASRPRSTIAALASTLPEEMVTIHQRRVNRTLGGLPEIVNALCACLDQTSDCSVRDAMLRTIVANPIRDMIHDMIRRSRDGSAILRQEIIKTLARMPDAVGPLMASLLVDDEVEVRCFVVGLVTDLPHPDSQDWLTRIIAGDRHAGVCTLAVEAMAQTGALRDARHLTQLKVRFPDDALLHLSIDKALCRVGSGPDPG